MVTNPEQQQTIEHKENWQGSSVEIAESIVKTKENLAKTQNNIETENNLNILEWDVFGNMDLNSINQTIQEYDNQKLALIVDIYLDKYKQLRKWIRSHEWSGVTKRDLKNLLTENIENLQWMKDDLKKYQYNNPVTYKWRVWELIYFFEHYEQVRQIVVLGWRTWDIHRVIDSKQDARRAERSERQNQRYEQQMAEILKDTALVHLLGNDQERLKMYYEDVINWHVEPSSHPFYTEHMGSFKLLEKISPKLYWTLVPSNSGRIVYNTYCQRNPETYQAYCQNNNIVCHPKSFNNRIWEWLADMAEKIGLNKENDPRKRQAREKAWSVVALGWAVVLWFKFLQSLFSKKHEWKRKEVGLYWAWLLGVLNLDKITNRAQDITWWHPAEKTRMLAESFQTYWFSDRQAIEMADRYIWAPVTTISALHFIPIYELESQHILENNNGEINFIYGNFENYVNKFSWDNNQKEQVLKAFWIATRDKLRSLFGSDKNKTLAQTQEVQDWWGNMVERVRSWVNKELYNHGLRAKNPEVIDTIMSEYGDWQKSKEEVNKLILDWMRRGLLELASDDKTYTINDMLTKIEFTSKINLENMTMNWFIDSWWTEIKFDSYWDLFDAVNISNWIKNHFNRPAKSENPFHIDPLTWRIEFDNTNRYDLTHNETSVVKLLTLKKNSTLFKNRGFYVDYLNKQRKENRIEQNKVDLSWYQLLKNVWIDFVDENEAIDTEKCLEKIKKDLEWRTAENGITPFEISWTWNSLIFVAIWKNKETIINDLSIYPTLKKDKEKLLRFLNNPDNKMRWSWL